MQKSSILLIFLFIFLSKNNALGSEQQTILVGGTGSAMGFMRILAKAYSERHKESTIKVLPSLGSRGGIRALRAGDIHIAISSRSLRDNEKGGLQEDMLGESPFIFATHPLTRINNVTANQIIDIYTGTLTTWNDGERIRPILRPENDTDWGIIRSISPDMAEALDAAQEREGMKMAVTDADAADYLESVNGSFGPSTLAMILAENRNINILSYNFISPLRITSTQTPYPLAKTYYFVTRQTPTPQVAEFMRFIFSQEGRKILDTVGVNQPHLAVQP